MSQTEKSFHVFGIRHLSPSGAFHLIAFLNKIKPTAVLIEGLSDGNSQIEHFTRGDTKLPIAILAYTEDLPVRTLLYPFANYSPEYQALIWATQNNAHAEFIDLPSSVFIKLLYMDNEASENTEQKQRGCIYAKWADIAGEGEHDTYWERNFEHNLNIDAYRLSAYEFGKSLRALSRDNPIEHAKNLVREAFMRNRIQKVIASGHNPEKVVVVTGAYHASVLGADYEPMSDEEIVSLPRVNTRLTLMPYSYYRLSSRSGYGAGNNAPAYYEMMWECLLEKDLAKMPSAYLTSIVMHLRENGTYRSAAEVIEGVRLSAALAALHLGSAPTLKDLRDAAMICLGHGELSVISEAIAHTEVGTSIGSLPQGVSRTSIQDDFYRELSRLKLDKYKSVVAMNLELDLRENRRVKSEVTAYIDLNRSYFLHRMRALGISFQKFQPAKQQSATWAESWILQWTPEAEIELVEATLIGETVALAATYRFKEVLEKCEKIEAAAKIIKEACECGLTESMEMARVTLQRLAVDSGAFNDVATAASELSTVISYGDIRKFDSSHLLPLLQQLFLRGTLLLVDAAKCDNQAAALTADSIHKLNAIALEHDALVDEGLFIRMLTELSEKDDRNPRLSGFACSILLERNILDHAKLSQEVSRRLSPGVDADLGAGWFEGLSMRNRYALLSKLDLWKQIDGYIASLEPEQFKRALVFLRRAFGDFGVVEKRSICENLGEIWGTGKDDASDVLSRELSNEEKDSISKLNEFDFGDI